MRFDTALSFCGSNPSRDITKKMRLCPYIMTRITDGSATSAASAMSFAASGCSSVRMTNASGSAELPT